jgi:hypothetical protein
VESAVRTVVHFAPVSRQAAKDVVRNNFPFWDYFGKRCAALPFAYVASHTALRVPCTTFSQAAPKREVITHHILSHEMPY